MQANDHSLMVYQTTTLYNTVSTNYIMKPLSEWSRIANIAGKSKDTIEADRKKLLNLCIEAESGIKKVLESEEKIYPAQRKSIEEKKTKRNEL